MNNNPIQVILNASDYKVIPENHGGGSNKDFFVDNDYAFSKHKQKLLGDIESVKVALNKLDMPSVFVHVTLRAEALAKSHRPIKKVFKEENTLHVGGASLGDMIVEINNQNIDSVEDAIRKAEEVTTRKEKIISNEKRLVVSPSAFKSEVGAIESIRLHDETDKVKFSLDTAFEWLNRKNTGGGYFIEFFSNSILATEKSKDCKSHISQMFQSFEMSLRKQFNGIEFIKISKNKINVEYCAIFISHEKIGDKSFHADLLKFLVSNALVKKVHLPPIINKANTPAYKKEGEISKVLPNPNTDADYPVVGIVDTGVESIDFLNKWCVGRSDLLDGFSLDKSHGTFISGLISGGAQYNKNINALQEPPCKFYDLGLFSSDAEVFSENYPRGFYDFLQQLNIEIDEAKKAGVRIFNMSLSLILPVDDDSYGFFASVIDEISLTNDVIFVLPAGNLGGTQLRDPWPDDVNDVLSMLAKYRYQGKDRIYQPCESITSISVGAFDTPINDDIYKPSQYTRKGPGPVLGAKPDVSHVGGTIKADTGLYSIDTSGSIISGCGTSYSAPLVAKSLAILDKSIQGYVAREVLYGLMVHNAIKPENLCDKKLNEIIRDYIGFGLPRNTNDIVLYDDFSISMVFHAKLMRGEELCFDFLWPESLINENGSCRGDINLTLVYTPVCDYRFGEEFVRTNLDVYLRQANVDADSGEVSYSGVMKDEKSKIYEKEMVLHGFKWWPVKKYTQSLKRKGNSSSWRLVVDSLSRAMVDYPRDGIPFAVILSISDPDKKAHVFDDMRRGLIAQGVNISDIRTAHTVVQRA